MPVPKATLMLSWDHARDVWTWETADSDTLPMFEASDVFSETWPTSGMTRNGRVYPLPMQEHPTAGSGCSSLLPTPEAKNAGSGPDYARMNRPGSGGHDLVTALWLLPTPQTSDQAGAAPADMRRKSPQIRAIKALLPTPDAQSGRRGPRSAEALDDGNRQVNLNDLPRLLPTPSVSDATGGHANRSGTRSGELLLPGVARSIGGNTSQPSDGGKPSSDDQHPTPPSPDQKADSNYRLI